MKNKTVSIIILGMEVFASCGKLDLEQNMQSKRLLKNLHNVKHKINTYIPYRCAVKSYNIFSKRSINSKSFLKNNFNVNWKSISCFGVGISSLYIYNNFENKTNQKEVMQKIPLPYVIVNDENQSEKKRQILTTKAAKVRFPLNQEDKNILKTLEAQFDSEKGCLGLAAPQIGFSKQVIIFAVGEENNFRDDFFQTLKKQIWINPSYINIGNETHFDYEGCFSVNDICGLVERFNKIEYKAFLPNGKLIKGEAEGFLARVIQHEIDHINGITCLNKIPNGYEISFDEYADYKKQQKGELNSEAEEYISKLINKDIPYEKKILDYSFKINDNSVYPPGGKSCQIFIDFLSKNNLIGNKTFAEIGCGSFVVGIIAAKKGAKQVIGIDINPNAIKCGKKNIKNYKVKDNAELFIGNGVKPLLPKYKGKIDIIYSSIPWDTISSEKFVKIPEKRQLLSRAFYDIDNKLLLSILTDGFDLLSDGGSIFISSTDRIMPKIKKICRQNFVTFETVAKGLHNNGNMHYILKISKLDSK